MEEIWKDIKNYEGLYQVSNLGRVKSLDRYRICSKNQSVCILKGQIRKLRNNGKGYLQVSLSDGHRNYKVFYVHRLVAEAFLENPFGLSDVNHINEIKGDNRVTNLEWSSHINNCNYGDRNKKIADTYKKNQKEKLDK